MSKQAVAIFWFRRDLRLDDNVGFYHALQENTPVLPIFIFDPEILDQLPKNDARVSFIFETLQNLRKELQENHESSLAIFHDSPKKIYQQLIKEYDVKKVITNHDYEPYAEQRDKAVQKLLEQNDIEFSTYKDQVIFEKNEVVKNDGDPYVVYTPYMKKWKQEFKKINLQIYDTQSHLKNLIKNTRLPNLTLSAIGFETSNVKVLDYDVTPTLIKNYENTRNIPAIEGTSKLGPHLRFGTVSVRKMLKKAIAEKNETFWNELIWREFFMQILWHYPKTVHDSFKSKYDRIKWRNNKKEFEKWCKGETGFPLVDAGMRQLNETGYIHNRIRMLVGSFLCKDLLIDWRWGEAYFAEKLLDYEMSSNVGNWQWVSGCGVDAAPYFRIFNPTTQIDKFDKDHSYIKTWVKDLNEFSYPDPMVNHKEARERCLETYKKAIH
ncbi:cryptochrome/photolyase family protein [Zhouia sp. PK063]|uniref:cryptochrome/photolyase family protein n=1 Tax=Zhouia sp. PK063 TaxID=3373602 RepID=UPI00379661C5